METQNRSEKMEDRLRKEEQETKALITDISHQLKTPIASLKMSYEIEDSTELSEEERAEFIRKEREDVKPNGESSAGVCPDDQTGDRNDPSEAGEKQPS